MIEEIVVGSEEDGKVNHYTITFIFQTGLQIKKSDKNKGLYSYSTDDTCRVRGNNTKERIVEIAHFTRDTDCYQFTRTGHDFEAKCLFQSWKCE